MLVAVTALAAGITTIIMGIYAKKPLALAPGMGLNAYFAYIAPKYWWKVALAAVFVEGIIFIILSITKVRSAIIHAIPLSQKYAVGAGIGLFLTFIGLNNIGLPTAVTKGGALQLTGLNASALATRDVILFFSLFLAGILISLRIKGSLLISIMTTSVLGWITGAASWPEHLFSALDKGG